MNIFYHIGRNLNILYLRFMRRAPSLSFHDHIIPGSLRALTHRNWSEKYGYSSQNIDQSQASIV